ncbi:hypothetical protein VPH35_128586 [Triticum aestivum]
MGGLSPTTSSHPPGAHQHRATARRIALHTARRLAPDLDRRRQPPPPPARDSPPLQRSPASLLRRSPPADLLACSAVRTSACSSARPRPPPLAGWSPAAQASGARRLAAPAGPSQPSHRPTTKRSTQVDHPVLNS